MERSNRIKWTTSARLNLLHAYMTVEEEIRSGMFTGDEWTEVTARTWRAEEVEAQKLRSSTAKQFYDLRREYKKYVEGGSKPPRLNKEIVRKLKSLVESSNRHSASSPTSPSSASKEHVVSERERVGTSECSASRCHGVSADPHKDGEVEESDQDEGVEIIKQELESLRDWFEEEIVPIGTEIMKIVRDAAVKPGAHHNSSLSQSNDLYYSSKLMFGLGQERLDSVIRTRFIELKLQVLKSLQNISLRISEELRA